MVVVRHRTPVPPMYRFMADVLRPPLRVLTDYAVTGLEHVPSAGGFVVTPNHLSHFDPFPWAHVLYNEGMAPVFLAKSELFRSRWLGFVLRHAGQVPVYRETAQAADALRDAVAALHRGQTVGIYPEGTLTRDPDLWPMRGKTGAARLALQAGCPVVPVAQWGPQDVLPEYTTVPRLLPRKTIQVRFGPPVDLDDLRDGGRADRPTTETLMEATDRIMSAITAELEALRGETAPATRFDPKAHGLPATGNFTKPSRIHRRKKDR